MLLMIIYPILPHVVRLVRLVQYICQKNRLLFAGGQALNKKNTPGGVF